MKFNRREMLRGGVSALGFLALDGLPVFAAPQGWKPEKSPNLVFGAISDTHLRTDVTGKVLGKSFSDRYLVSALEYFKAQNVDAVVHCGDFAHRGQTMEMQFHADAWRRVFGRSEVPVKLFVSGNHEFLGADCGDFVQNIYPDPEERAKHALVTDMAGNWERIWGEKYEPVWHKEVKGYHFFGRQWDVDESTVVAWMKQQNDAFRLSEGTKPFFMLSHIYPHTTLNNAVAQMRNAVAFFGHWHNSATNWNEIFYHGYPYIQVPCCKPTGPIGFSHDEYITRVKLDGKEAAGVARQGYVVKVYDDMLTIERREFGEGGSLGPDWVMPLNWGTYPPSEASRRRRCPSRGGNGERGTAKHPFLKNELKKVIGEPQFGAVAKLMVGRVVLNAPQKDTPGGLGTSRPTNRDAIRITIPLADGNLDSRVYAYELVVVGDEGSQKLFKAVYAAGVNLGIGHEPNGGVTTLEIPKAELPEGKKLTIAVRPLSSLGTAGRAIATTWRV